MTGTATIHKTVFFKAPRETVWAFLTDKDKLGLWYFAAEADLAEGEDYSLYRVADDGTRARQVWGRVMEMNAPSKLVTTFCFAPLENRETTITWTLETAAGGTRLSLAHEGIEEAAGAAALSLLTALDAGWDKHIGNLRPLIND